MNTKWQHGLSRRANGCASASQFNRNTTERPTEDTKKRSYTVQHLTSALNAHSDLHSLKTFLPTTHFTSCLFTRRPRFFAARRTVTNLSFLSASIQHVLFCCDPPLGLIQNFSVKLPQTSSRHASSSNLRFEILHRAISNQFGRTLPSP